MAKAEEMPAATRRILTILSSNCSTKRFHNGTLRPRCHPLAPSRHRPVRSHHAFAAQPSCSRWLSLLRSPLVPQVTITPHAITLPATLLLPLLSSSFLLDTTALSLTIPAHLSFDGSWLGP